MPDPDFNDFAFLFIRPAGELMELSDTGGALGPSSSAIFTSETGYQRYAFALPESGDYTIAVGVVDVGDDAVTSGLLLDAVLIPEPTMSALAFLSLLMLRRSPRAVKRTSSPD